MKMKRILAGLLAGATAISGIGFSAFAEGGSEENYAAEEAEETFDTEEEAAGEIAINETNFPDENFRAYVSTTIDTDGNGSLSAKERAAVQKIDVYNYDISSLFGIEYFTELTMLNCTHNKLTSLDVSKNNALKELWCYNNQLASIDVRKNAALKKLNCVNNQLTSLDVSNNTALETLYCSSNKLTTLDVSNNTALNGLSCSSNQLNTLDVSKNAALTEFNCHDNLLISLDVSKNTALTVFYCSCNQLTSLDVSKNTSLEYLDCAFNQLSSLYVSKNTAMYYLDCGSNQLTSLDVSKNTALKELGCYYNQLTSLDVSRNTELTKLSTDKEITIYGIAGSSAEAYAKKKGITFIAVELPAPSQPATVKSSANMLGATVMCSKVDGATKYRLFYTADNGKSYEKVGDTTTRKWEVTGMKAGVEYKFLVLAYDGKKWSSYKKGDSYAAVTPSPTVKVTVGKGKAVVTCSTVSGAKTYRLFYTTDNGKSYKKVGDNTTRKWTVTGLKSGTEYKFLVLCYDGKSWSKYTKGDCYAAVTIK